jgi:hypothetical protein
MEDVLALPSKGTPGLGALARFRDANPGRVERIVRSSLDQFLDTRLADDLKQVVEDVCGFGKESGADKLLAAMSSGLLEIDQFAEGYSERRLICVLYWIPGVPLCSFLTRANSLMAER